MVDGSLALSRIAAHARHFPVWFLRKQEHRRRPEGKQWGNQQATNKTTEPGQQGPPTIESIAVALTPT